ncbi:MAG TPA: hypothetical protein PLD10_03705 [Rhodopila sp.]|nr:hypothetical protein [Rhodopila sp.]
MDAAYFRSRAARARAMAQNGDDIRISGMLLEVANELDAEADLIEAEAKAKARLRRPAEAPDRAKASSLLVTEPQI